MQSTAAIITRVRMMTIPPATVPMTYTLPLVRRMTMSKCSNCIHAGQETTDDVACCNCCGEDFEFYEPIDDDPFHENDPYVVTHPMAFY